MLVFAGYVGSKSFLEKVADIIQDLRKCNPALIYGKYSHFLWLKNKYNASKILYQQESHIRHIS